MIRFDRVSKRYGAHQALTDVSFTVPRGQVVGLLGQNGAGKSTAMNILTGCLAPTAGKVTVDGFDVLISPRPAKRRLGYLPENAPLYDEMTVEKYLRFACQLKEVEKKAMAGHVGQVMEKTGLSGVSGRKIGNLSRGYRQRVGVAQALCGTPDALILDEPTAGLDPLQTSEMRALIRDLKGEHTILFSTHILSEAQQLCDRVIILHRGRVIRDQDMQALRGEDRRLRAVIACGEGALLPVLRKVQSIKDIQVERGGEAGTTKVLLTPGEGEEIERALFFALAQAGYPILRLEKVESSLEEIFLRATVDAET